MIKIRKKLLHIAIDGPVAAGKSIGASRLAKRLGILYVYTGAMYRAVAYLGLRNGLDLEKEAPLVKLLKKSKIELKKPSQKDRVCDVFLDGHDITRKLFSPRIHWGSSQVGVFSEVRKELVKIQKNISKNHSVVMEGRDITTVVLPQADLKIYMTASLKVRAKRRLKDLKNSGVKTSLADLMKKIEKRDKQDSKRKASPLKIAANAWILDTSKLTILEEVEAIVKKLLKMGLVE
ncbi:cytidylate kinase [Candidatus Beckwithbacteria bacterium CG10_big_fil_rev_8_21_14_0_10_34_10]|uniref:Cytidylate kinase n=1 Tax=Candidatus Beckwithbacteria bacterium CG10_big_fil_rev_8_21_14_0_10_34_10 TaxID=1974495 RepID=A0A2H0W7W7_9BACT|nr:MAG: cytidylate kinase [Candidatus Beckwithbacteria bacterium CG10_big_fil_rev_8_21_14_0_10_34_10]